MTRGRLVVASALALTLSGALGACSADDEPSAAPVDWRAVDAAVAELVDANDLGGAALVVVDGDERHERHYGDVEPVSALRLASAAKWVTAATVAAAADAGIVELDEPIAAYLPATLSASPAAEGAVTLRMLLSHVSGLPESHPCTEDARTSLTACASQILAEGAGEPGTFAYGSPGFQVAGAILEWQTGEEWSTIFDELLAGPLRLESARWGTLAGEPTSNPDLGAGLVMSARDYARFLTMLLRGGELEGVRVLDAATVDDLHRATVQIGDRAYGAGHQQVTMADGTTLLSSPGAFGTRPWIIAEHDFAAVFVAQRLSADVVAERPGDGRIHRAVHETFGVPEQTASA